MCRLLHGCRLPADGSGVPVVGDVQSDKGRRFQGRLGFYTDRTKTPEPRKQAAKVRSGRTASEDVRATSPVVAVVGVGDVVGAQVGDGEPDVCVRHPKRRAPFDS